jgi:hypothetical protein
MAGAAGPGGIPGKPVEIDKELVDMMAVADNIHDFSGDRSNIPIPVIVEGRISRDRYFESLLEIIGDNRKKPNNSEMKRPRITAPGGDPYDGGKIRIMKNSMKNVYLDELEKNIIRWGIKKGYIHKSNYLDLEKLLKN